MVARNDAQKRALNAALNPGDVWAERDAWLPCVQAVQERLMTLGVERPAGLPADGILCVSHYMLSASGFVKWVVRYQLGQQWTMIGGFVTEYLPEDDRPRLAMRPLETHGKTVVVNQKVAGELARPVRVLVDAGGLPVPVPEQIWQAMGLC